MEYSPSINKKAKALGVTPGYMIMADLMALGYTDIDAHSIAFPDEAILSSEARKRNMNHIVKEPKFKKLRADSRERIRECLSITDAEDVELISSESVAKEILISAMRNPRGSKERGDMLIKYAELMRKNDVADDTTDNQIQFYLPMCCDKCPLNIEYKAKKAKENEEMQEKIENS